MNNEKLWTNPFKHLIPDAQKHQSGEAFYKLQNALDMTPSALDGTLFFLSSTVLGFVLYTGISQGGNFDPSLALFSTMVAFIFTLISSLLVTQVRLRLFRDYATEFSPEERESMAAELIRVSRPFDFKTLLTQAEQTSISENQLTTEKVFNELTNNHRFFSMECEKAASDIISFKLDDQVRALYFMTSTNKDGLQFRLDTLAGIRSEIPVRIQSLAAQSRVESMINSTGSEPETSAAQ